MLHELHFFHIEYMGFWGFGVVGDVVVVCGGGGGGGGVVVVVVVVVVAVG